MATDGNGDIRILEAWAENAAAWTDAVRGQRIESRRRVTDAAILAAVHALDPRTVLDLGCGEGWLVRTLAADGIRAIGVDAIPELIERARDAGPGDYRVLSYADIAAGGLPVRADAAICNFSLLGQGDVDALVRAVPGLLAPGGTLVVQTLHPPTAGAGQPYADGWREGSWDGCGPGFGAPAPWYFRTLESWRRLFSAAGFDAVGTHLTRHPDSREPLSVLFMARTHTPPATAATDGGAT